jgi:helicase-like protein
MTGFHAEPVLAGLKDFQRDTVEYAFYRLFDAPGSTRRFLVADEVGLGKTMVARGVVAKTIERLQAERVPRIDVIYICSNSEIASQNIRKLNIAGSGAAFARRLGLLATQVQSLQDLNLIALTPGTSFERNSATGIQEERVLLYALLKRSWAFGSGTGPKNLLQATTRNVATFRGALRQFDREIDTVIAANFARALEDRERAEQAIGAETVRQRFDALCGEFRRERRHLPSEQRQRQRELIGELRAMLATAGIDALEPDLVILDEFQRFKHLLGDDPEDEAARLAQSLFNWERPETGEHARVLMLSATPYRALTIAGDGREDDHHEDFLATIRFLADSDEQTDALRATLREYGRQLRGSGPEAPARLRELAATIESSVSRYMARTERIGAAGRYDSMLTEHISKPPLEPDDVRQYLLAQDVAEALGQPDVTELWKSASYLLNFLDGYQLRARFDDACAVNGGRGELAEIVGTGRELLLDTDRIRSFQEIDPGGPRLRALAQDVIDNNAWRMLWIPPTLPYHQLGGAYGRDEVSGFTKRLVFSAWNAVPRSAAGLLSYLADRRLTLAADAGAENTTERRSAQRNRLNFSADQTTGRLTGMPALALIYPSPALAAAADPRDFARRQPDATIDELVAWAHERIEPLLAELARGTGDLDNDPRWYWAAPLLLDAAERGWWDADDLPARWSDWDTRATAEGSRWNEHVDLAADTVDGALDPPLGGRPDDLLDVLTQYALGGPATIALRALSRSTSADLVDVAVRDAAAQTAWGLRGLFNSPEATALLRAEQPETFWREVLRHCIDGDLQAVLDEYTHLLRESEGLTEKPVDEAANVISAAIADALQLRSSSATYSSIELTDGTIRTSPQRLYTAYAMRFADEDGRDPGSNDVPARASQLRVAFNSPFWPFVLVSTSVGQEGLDFHPYCHAVVHWNLPTNPIDLEQREGRVHRYKGHAIRKNVAEKHRVAALAGEAGDPWTTAFELAAGDRDVADSELVPFWIYPGSASVERHVLALPYSRELDRLEALRNALSVYRLAFGQARQQDVIDHLLARLGPERAAALAAELRIDLRPPRLASSSGTGSRTSPTR